MCVWAANYSELGRLAPRTWSHENFSPALITVTFSSSYGSDVNHALTLFLSLSPLTLRFFRANFPIQLRSCSSPRCVWGAQSRWSTLLIAICCYDSLCDVFLFDSPHVPSFLSLTAWIFGLFVHLYAHVHPQVSEKTRSTSLNTSIKNVKWTLTF